MSGAPAYEDRVGADDVDGKDMAYRVVAVSLCNILCCYAGCYVGVLHSNINKAPKSRCYVSALDPIF